MSERYLKKLREKIKHLDTDNPDLRAFYNSNLLVNNFQSMVDKYQEKINLGEKLYGNEESQASISYKKLINEDSEE